MVYMTNTKISYIKCKGCNETMSVMTTADSIVIAGRCVSCHKKMEALMADGEHGKL